MPLPRLIKVLNCVRSVEERLDLSHALSRAGSWRGLFDPYSSKWDRIGIEAKVELLGRILKETGLSLGAIVRAFQADYVEEYPEVAATVPDALSLLIEAFLSHRSSTREGAFIHPTVAALQGFRPSCQN